MRCYICISIIHKTSTAMKTQFRVISLVNGKAPHVGKTFPSRRAAWNFFKKLHSEYSDARDFWKNSGYDLQEE